MSTSHGNKCPLLDFCPSSLLKLQNSGLWNRSISLAVCHEVHLVMTWCEGSQSFPKIWPGQLASLMNAANYITGEHSTDFQDKQECWEHGIFLLKNWCKTYSFIKKTGNWKWLEAWQCVQPGHIKLLQPGLGCLIILWPLHCLYSQGLPKDPTTRTRDTQ